MSTHVNDKPHPMHDDGTFCLQFDMLSMRNYWLIILYTNIDQKLVNSLHRLLKCEIGGLDCRVITTEYRTLAHCIHV